MESTEREFRTKQWDPKSPLFREIAAFHNWPINTVRALWIEHGSLQPYDTRYRNPDHSYAKAPEFKRINLDRGYFEANGRKYFVQNFICIRRYPHYLRLQVEVIYGAKFKDIYEREDQVFRLLTSGNDLMKAVFTSAELLKNSKEAVRRFDERKFDSMLEFCTLFVNHESEDITVWDERTALSKIDDWGAEGYTVNDFFLLFQKSVEGFKKAYLREGGENLSDVFHIRDFQAGTTVATSGTIS